MAMSKPSDKTTTTSILEKHFDSESDSDYVPGEEEEDYEEEDDDLEIDEGCTEMDDAEETDEDIVFDKPEKRDGICSSSSSVSLEQGDHDEVTKHEVSVKASQVAKSGGSSIDLDIHKRFGSFVHKHEIPRKALHVSIGFFTLYFYTRNLTTKMFLPYLSSACAMLFGLDLIRFKYPEINKLYCKWCGFLMREKEINSYNGVIWYLLGLCIAFQFFPKDIGVMAVLLLSWSDTAASTFGRAYGKYTPKIARNKSLAGSIAAFFVGVISCLVFYGYFIPAYNHLDDVFWSKNSSKLSLPWYAVCSGFIASLSEGIDVYNWDDNFTIPVFSSVFLYSLVRVAHI